MKNNCKLIDFIIIGIIIIGVGYLLIGLYSRPMVSYFPLNGNDKYVYSHQEGPEDMLLTITVKNVKQISNRIKQFEFLWSGKYNDRIQIFRESPDGISLCENKHLVGEPPLKTIRTLSSPLIMLPYAFRNSKFANTTMSTFDNQGNLVEWDKIESEISFVGHEEVTVEAGKFKCSHFFVRHDYKDKNGNSRQMHTYNFWVAPGLGFIKFMHIFVPFRKTNYVEPAQKNIMNRYSNPFVSLYELKEATISGKKIGG